MNVLCKKYFLLVIATLMLAGCGAFHDKMGNVNQVQLALFSTSVKPVLQTNCFSCHSVSGGAGAAFYMHPTDEVLLYSEALKRISGGNPDSSPLLQKGMGLGHPAGNKLSSTTDQEKIRQWILTAASGTTSGGGTGGGTGGGLFVTSVRPVLKTTCFGCHSNTSHNGFLAFPMNTTDDQVLYDEVIKRVVIGNPDTSVLVTKGAGMNHAGGNQFPTGADKEKIRQWILSSEVSNRPSSPGSYGGTTGGTTGGTSGGIPSYLKFTGTLSIPGGLTQSGSYQYLRFSLAALGHAGAFVEVGVRYYTEGGYEFSQWRVYSPNYPLRVNGLNILVSNGVSQNLTNTLATVILDAPKSAATESMTTPLSSSLLSTRAGTSTVIKPMGDEVKLGFSEVTMGGQSSNDQATFLQQVKPILLNNCNRCHGNAGGAGNLSMPNNNDVILYMNVRQKVLARDYVNSALYIKGTGTGHVGGDALPLQTDRNTIINWINMIQ